jgi:uroporphyrinogen-III synthase
MHILITRPRDDAAELAAELAARGIESTLEPLLAVKPAAPGDIPLEGIQAVLFTSANGVRCFAAANPRRDLKVFTVGDNSAAVARELGFADVSSASGDVASLAELVTERLHPRDGGLLHAAGASLAGDLKGRLQAAGFVVERIVLYDAEPVTELSPATVMNLRLGGIDAVALFSPRTARTFADLWQKAQAPGGNGLGGVTALCLSAAVAAEIRDLGWRRIATAEQPDRSGMLALIERERTRGEPVMSDDRRTQPDEADAADAAADPARGASIIAAAPAPARPGSARAAIIGLLAGAIGGGGVVLAEPYWRPYLAPPAEPGSAAAGDDIIALTADVAALKEQLAALGTRQDVDSEARSRIDALQSEIAAWKSELEAATGQAAGAAGAAMDLAPLEGRLEALEGRLASLGARLDGLAASAAGSGSETPPPESGPGAATDDALNALTARLAGLEGRLGEIDRLQSENAEQRAGIEAATARLAALDGLGSRLDQLEAKASALGDDVARVASEQSDAVLKQQRAAAMVLSIGQLRAALSGDKPFAAELAVLADLAQPDADTAARLDPILAPLRDRAALGAPTLAQLQARFPATAIAQAATADAAGAAIGAEPGWLQQTLNRLAELVTIRPVGDVAGDGALATLARGESHLAAGDLAGAVAELENLGGQAAAAAAAWLTDAKARLAGDAAAAQLAVLSAEALVPQAGGAAEQSN